MNGQRSRRKVLEVVKRVSNDINNDVMIIDDDDLILVDKMAV